MEKSIYLHFGMSFGSANKTILKCHKVVEVMLKLIEILSILRGWGLISLFGSVGPKLEKPL